MIGNRGAEFAEIMQNDGNCAVQGHSKSSLSIPITSLYATTY